MPQGLLITQQSQAYFIGIPQLAGCLQAHRVHMHCLLYCWTSPHKPNFNRYTSFANQLLIRMLNSRDLH